MTTARLRPDGRHECGIDAVSGTESKDTAASRMLVVAYTGNQQRPIRKREVAGLLAVSLLWALCYPLIAVGVRFAPPLAFAALRALIAGVALVVLALVLGRPVPRDMRTWAMLSAIGLGTTSLGFFGMFDASGYASPGLATVIANGQPLLAAVLAHFTLAERLGPMQRLGLLLGFFGIVVISLPQFDNQTRASFAVGVAYIVFAAGGVAIGNILMKALGRGVDALVATGAQTLIGALPLSIGALVIERPATIVWSPIFLMSLFALALFGTALAYWLWFALLARVPFTRANAFTFVTPIAGFAIGVGFFGERLGIAALIGLPLTAVGIILVERIWPTRPTNAHAAILSVKKERRR